MTHIYVSDSDCSGDLKCFHRDGANSTAGVPGCSGEGQPKIDYCYDPGRVGADEPAEGYGADVCGPMLGTNAPKNCLEFSLCTYDYVISSSIKDKLPDEIANQAREECINGLLPYNATLPSPSGYADSECDTILVGLIDDTTCDNFYECVLKWETVSPTSSARILSNATMTEAETDCAALVDNNNVLDPIFGK